MMLKTIATRKLVVILTLYVLLATSYSIIVPIGQGADEWAHYWYAQFIAQNGRLPVNPTERETAGYKSDWPPLYHFFAAGLIAWIDTDGPPTFKYRADNVRRHLVPQQGSDAILHTQDEFFPWQQEILVWHLGRFLSILFSVGTLIMTYYVALEIFTPQIAKEKSRTAATTYAKTYTLPGIPSQTLALVAVAILAFNPRFLFTSMLFNYDSLTLLLASIFLWITIRVVKSYDSHWNFWILGAIAGLTLTTKYLAAPLVIIIIFLAWHMGVETQESKNTKNNRCDEVEMKRRYHASCLTHHAFNRKFLIHLTQAFLTYFLVTSWWFGYLFVNFNEIETYGPMLGTLSPLLRGDGSDRTVEEIFAWLSGGQAPPPAYIEKQSYTTWQIITEFPTTFWGNPIVRPYPLNWFIGIMSLITLVAAGGLSLFWRTGQNKRFWLSLWLLYCTLPVPFMIIRLFGARDILEALQGRHILFLAGPAFSMLLVVGLWSVSQRLSSVLYDFPYAITSHFSQIIFMALLGLFVSGAVNQLIFMANVYARPLPIQTTPYTVAEKSSILPIVLEGGARLIDYRLEQQEQALKVTLVWQGSNNFAPEDYQIELQLTPQNQLGDEQLAIAGWQAAVAGWQAYQTQARYPTRTWEPDDVIYDVGWLPLTNVAAGDYEIQVRILGQYGPIIDWQMLTPYILQHLVGLYRPDMPWTLWKNGQPGHKPIIFSEHETVQLTFSNSQELITNNQLPTTNLQLQDSQGNLYHPTSTGSTWANFIIEPNWLPGNYYLAGLSNNAPVLQVTNSQRNFQIPQITHPLEANFEGQVKLLGYDLPTRRVKPGDGLPITLYWQGLRWMGEDFVIFDRLLDNQQIAWGGYDRLPGENYSTLLWAPAEIVIDGFAVPIAADAPSGIYSLSVGLYRQVDGEAKSLVMLNPETGASTETTSVMIGPIKVGGAPSGITIQGIVPQTNLNVALGDKIKLLGFDITNPESPKIINDKLLLDTSSIGVIFYWQTLSQMDVDYTVFVHIRNSNGEVVAQKDSPPTQGSYPTSLWDTGEIIQDQIDIPVEQLGPGQYEMVVGMYDFTTGIRLLAAGLPDGAIRVQSFEILEK